MADTGANPDYETRYFETGGLEIRAGDTPDAPRVIVGYAAVFNTLSEEIYGFREQIAPGAFAESIAKDDVVALWAHDSARPLARKSAGSLKLSEDKRGLKVEIIPPATTWGNDALIAVGAGVVRSFSFGFRVLVDKWDETTKPLPTRTLERVQLREVSPVTFPAYPGTSAEARNQADAIKGKNAGAGAGDGSGGQASNQDGAYLENRRYRLRLAAIE